MAIGNGHNSSGLNADMNVTPLIDVLLVLLMNSSTSDYSARRASTGFTDAARSAGR
jgi:hypothetical protein